MPRDGGNEKCFTVAPLYIILQFSAHSRKKLFSFWCVLLDCLLRQTEMYSNVKIHMRWVSSWTPSVFFYALSLYVFALDCLVKCKLQRHMFKLHKSLYVLQIFNFLWYL